MSLMPILLTILLVIILSAVMFFLGSLFGKKIRKSNSTTQLLPSFESIEKILRKDNVTDNAAYILGASQAYGIILNHIKKYKK